jgi:hypothetical protein
LKKKLHNEEGLDLKLCGETIELLAFVLFGEEKKKIYCKNCGKELQEEWKNCPYCSTQTANIEIQTIKQESPINVESQIKPKALYEEPSYSNNSQTQQPIKPTVSTSSGNTVEQETVKLTGGQWFFVILIAVGSVFASSYFIYGNIDKFWDCWWVAWLGGFIMHSIFQEINKSKRKKNRSLGT